MRWGSTEDVTILARAPAAIVAILAMAGVPGVAGSGSGDRAEMASRALTGGARAVSKDQTDIQSTEDYKAEIEKWRKEREAGLYIFNQPSIKPIRPVVRAGTSPF